VLNLFARHPETVDSDLESSAEAESEALPELLPVDAEPETLVR